VLWRVVTRRDSQKDASADTAVGAAASAWIREGCGLVTPAEVRAYSLFCAKANIVMSNIW
jgi:hypothetical protein